MSTPEITVVIVAWNSAASIPASLGALRRSAASAGESLELVVVDNASVDDSTALAREAGADLVIENPMNAGYVVAASQGIALARGAWVMLANPDLTVSEGFVTTMLDAVRSAGPDVAALVPDIRYAADPDVVNSRGIEVDAIGIPAEVDAGRLADDITASADVFSPSTSGCLLRRSALVEVGGLEPLYFAYLEDVDLGWRLRKKGYRTLVVPGAVALHEGSVSTGEGSWLKAFLVARNRRVLFRLHGPPGFSARALRTVTEIGHATVQALSGSGTASVRGRAAALRTRRYTHFLRVSNRAIGISDDAPVRLARRQSLNDALRRKRAAASLMHQGEAAAAPAVAKRKSRARMAVSSAASRRAAGGALRVLVDATNLKPGQGGIRTYTIGLLEALSAQSELSVVVATSVDDVAALGPMDVVDVSPRTQGVLARALWRERNLVALARSERADVILTPVPELPLRRLPIPSVIVVHDVGPLVAPVFYSFPKKIRYQAVLPRTCKMASAVVCVSHATLVDLLASTETDPDRCEVIGEGPQLLGPGAAGARADGPYLLYVGSLEARKNVETLVEGFRLASVGTDVKLLMAGPVESRASSHLLGSGDDRVTHLGFVSPEDLAALYRDALAVALPSLYEGFGLSVLEAMKLGTPVVASDIPPVHEVAGDAALYVSNPRDPSAWGDAISRLRSDPSLRADLTRRGVIAAERFSWEDVGRRFSGLLHRVAARSSASSVDGASRSAARVPSNLPAGAEPAE